MPEQASVFYTFRHSWKDISLASWLKYPCDERPDVKSVDIIDRSFDPNTGILRAKRLIIIQKKLPVWLKAILGSDLCYFLEESVIDPRNNLMKLTGTNISYSSIMLLKETCTYTIHPENNAWTRLQQEASASAFVFGFSSRIEKYCVNSFEANAAKGRAVMENTVHRLKIRIEGTRKDGLALMEGIVDSTKASWLELKEELKEAALEDVLHAQEKKNQQTTQESMSKVA